MVQHATTRQEVEAGKPFPPPADEAQGMVLAADLPMRLGPPMQQIRQWNGVSSTFSAAVGNGDRKVFRVYSVSSGVDQWFELCRFSADLSTVEDSVRLDPKPEPPTGQNKADAPAVYIVQYPNGTAAVRVMGTSHLTDPPRPYMDNAVDVTDMGAVYQAGMGGHMVGQPITGGGGTVSVDYNEIQARMHTELLAHEGRQRQEFGGNIRDGIRDMVVSGNTRVDAEEDYTDPDASRQHGLEVARFYKNRFQRRRVYQTFEENAPGFWAWLKAKVAG